MPCRSIEANTIACVRGAGGGAGAQKVERAGEAQRASGVGVQMLEALRELPWRRIDVCFRGTSVRFFAHNLIQARACALLSHTTSMPFFAHDLIQCARSRSSSSLSAQGLLHQPPAPSVRICDGCCTDLRLKCACFHLAQVLYWEVACPSVVKHTIALWVVQAISGLLYLLMGTGPRSKIAAMCSSLLLLCTCRPSSFWVSLWYVCRAKN